MGVVMNVLSTVGVVLANKFLWVEYKFEYMITLSFFHMVFTAIGCRVLLVRAASGRAHAPCLGFQPDFCLFTVLIRIFHAGSMSNFLNTRLLPFGACCPWRWARLVQWPL